MHRLSTACIGICILLMGLVGCQSTVQQEVNNAAYEVLESVYLPSDAVLLTEKQWDDALAYHRGCTGALIERVYGIDRSLHEVMVEYDQQLLNSGWWIHPGYDTSMHPDSEVYQWGPEANLRFTTRIVWAPLKDNEAVQKKFTTIYVIRLTYTEPSNKDCTG